MAFRSPFVGATGIWSTEPALSLHHVVLSTPGTVAECFSASDGRRIVLDAVTALLLDGTDVACLLDLQRRAEHVTVIPIDPVMLRARHAPIVAIRQPQRRRALRIVVLSPAALLLAQRLREPAGIGRIQNGVRRLGAPAGSHDVSCFVEELLACARSTAPIASRSTRRSAWPAIADGVREQLATEPSAAHPIAELAVRLGVSPFHLARLFRAETGLSVHQYLLRLRMASALDHLCSDSLSLSRLALDLGFSSHSHFTAAFRRQFDASPANVREQLRSGRLPGREVECWNEVDDRRLRHG